jgi:hypothetical protein
MTREFYRRDTKQAHADRISDERAEAYIEAFDANIAAQAKEYDAEFGEEYRAKHPFKADTMAAHLAAMGIINQGKEE